MKTLVYTIITGNYDTLRPFKREPGFDYFCYTDNLDIEANGWDLKKILNPKKLSHVKLQRLLKISPTQFYKRTIYIDANFQIIGSLKELLDNHYRGGFLTIKHPNRTLMSEEARQIIRLRKDKPEIVNKHMAMLRLMCVPNDCGMYAAGLLVRDNTLNDIQNKWAELLINGSHRDQLSLSPAAWLTKTNIYTITWQEMQKYFQLTPHKRNAGILQ